MARLYCAYSITISTRPASAGGYWAYRRERIPELGDAAVASPGSHGKVIGFPVLGGLQRTATLNDDVRRAATRSG